MSLLHKNNHITSLLNGRNRVPTPRPSLSLYPLSTPAGAALIGIHKDTIVWLSLDDPGDDAVAKYWEGPVTRKEGCPISPEELIEVVNGSKAIGLMPIGTDFQMRVWSSLLEIPFSSTATYGELAEELGSAKLARAVGSAVGANPIAWLIPCHRILPSSGGLGGYRWGTRAKEKLLTWESKTHPDGVPGQEAEDRRKLEAMLLNAQRFEDIGRLAGNIAHDLNNLLAPIRMATELMKRKLKDNSVDRYVEIIETSTGRARSVIQEILAFSRESESDEVQVININPLLHELEKMIRETFPSEIEIQFTYRENNPLVEIDPHQLHRSVLNLLVNARDAIEGAGSIHVNVSSHNLGMQIKVAERSLHSGRYICISVTDTGCGISEEIRGAIFDPFFTTKPKEKGTGLGLASVFGIIARAGGYVDLESVEGEGSSFHIYLPESTKETT